MEQTKRIKIVQDFFRAWETSMSKVRPYLTEDIVWWTRWGTKTLSNYDDVAPAVAESVTEKIKFTVKDIVAEGDRMAVEASAIAKLKNGSVYDQDYFFLLEFSGDKIRLVKEYFDTKHAYEIWGPILAAYISPK